MSGLANKTFIISGASQGIGRALAVELARRGARLVLNARGAQGLETAAMAAAEAAAEAAPDGPLLGEDAVAMVPGNAAHPDCAARLVETAMALNPDGLDGLVHAAGVLRPGPTLWELPPDHFDEVVEASVTAAHRLLAAAMPVLLDQGHGLVVLFGSGSAEIVQPGIAAYCAAKAAEEHLVRQLAEEAPDVTSLVYRPGVVETRMQEQARQAEGGAAHVLRPMFQSWKDRGQLLTPEASARALANIMESPAPFHGRIATVADGR